MDSRYTCILLQLPSNAPTFTDKNLEKLNSSYWSHFIFDLL